MTPEELLQKCLEGKKQWRKEQAALPIEEKVKILIKLQHIAYQIAQQVGRPCRKPWGME